MKKNKVFIIILIIFITAVALIPMFLSRFDLIGSDDAAKNAVTSVDPGYKPWAKPVLELTNEKTETLLFCLQAGIGAGTLGLGFGYLVLRKKKQKDN
jgi:ABC-type cobalt transport system, periplasmic component